jgi:hypothetical protein
MTTGNRELEQLALAYESLTGADLQRADDYLAQNPQARSRLSQLQALEAAAADPVPADGAWPDTELNSEEEAAQLSSLSHLLASFDRTDEDQRTTSWWRRGSILRPSLLLPVAAMIAMAVVLPRVMSDKIVINDLAIVVSGTAVGSDRAGTVKPTPGILRSGERFRLRFNLTEDSHVLVVHAASDGAVAVVYPNDLTQPVPLMPSGSHVVPNPAEDRSWALDHSTGVESFFVIGAPTSNINVESLLAELATMAATGEDREVLIGSLEKRLGILGSTLLIEFQHQN